MLHMDIIFTLGAIEITVKTRSQETSKNQPGRKSRD